MVHNNPECPANIDQLIEDLDALMFGNPTHSLTPNSFEQTVIYLNQHKNRITEILKNRMQSIRRNTIQD
jgi:hypothetical protein